MEGEELVDGVAVLPWERSSSGTLCDDATMLASSPTAAGGALGAGPASATLASLSASRSAACSARSASLTAACSDASQYAWCARAASSPAATASRREPPLSRTSIAARMHSRQSLHFLPSFFFLRSRSMHAAA